MHPNDSLAVVIVARTGARIADCIASAAFADEVLVLDARQHRPDRDDRADGGRARRRHRLARFCGPQVARGFSLAQTDWVLSLDADERIPAKLQAEIRTAIRVARTMAHRIPRWSGSAAR
jgi:hypothetical protein